MYSQDQPSSLSKPSDTTASGDSFLLLLICLYLELESQIKTPRSYLELLFATHQMIELQDFVYLSPYLDIWSICMWFFGNRKLGFLLLQICQQSVFIAPLSGDIFDLDMLWFQKTWFFFGSSYGCDGSGNGRKPHSQSTNPNLLHLSENTLLSISSLPHLPQLIENWPLAHQKVYTALLPLIINFQTSETGKSHS